MLKKKSKNPCDIYCQQKGHIHWPEKTQKNKIYRNLNTTKISLTK